MNIFYLHNDPKTCAKLHCDKHVVKMIIEYAQLLSTAHRIIDGNEWHDVGKRGQRVKRWKLDNEVMENNLYKACHVNHPSAIWARQNVENYNWLADLWWNLCKEYTHRYGKVHMTETKLGQYLFAAPKKIPEGEFFEPPPAMQHYPQCIVKNDSIQSYINYYREAKKHFAKWTSRPIPEFMY